GVAEGAIRAEGATPATIAVVVGRPTIGLSDAELERFARSDDILKASRRDLAAAVVQNRDAATTVAATMALAHRAGIRFFATGGIGGAQRGDGPALDSSRDPTERGRPPVALVVSRARSVRGLPRA